MKRSQHLMQKIDALRDELSKKDGLIDQRRRLDPTTSPTSYAQISEKIKQYEDEIDKLIFARLELLDHPEKDTDSAPEDDRDVDVMEETLHLVRNHLKKAGFDLPFLDDCAAAATKHIKELRKTLKTLSIGEIETTEDRDHRPYDVKRKFCRACRASVMSAIKYGDGWSATGEELTHAKDCILKDMGVV